MADKKISELTAITNLSGDDLLLVVNDPSGSPTSNKITHKNFFANVVSNTVHKGVVTHKANTSFTGTTMTVTANLVYNGTEIGNRYASWTAHTATNTAIRTLVSDRLQVANATSTFATKANSAFVTANYVTNTAFQQLTVVATSSIVNATAKANTPLLSISSGNGLVGTKRSAPSSNNTATESLTVGTIFFSNNYLYIATDATTIKRVSLEVFS